MSAQRYNRRELSVPALIRFVVSLVLVSLCAALKDLFASSGERFFPAYRSFSKMLMLVLAQVSSIVPFAVWDLLILAAAVGFVVLLVHAERQRKSVIPIVSWLCLAVSLAVFVSVGGWTLNHYAPSLATEMELRVRTYSTDELAEATEYYLSEAAELAQEVPREDDGSLKRQNFFELARVCGSSYQGLASRYPIFRGSTAPVKALLLWGEPLLWSGHTGIFWAATGEAGVPLNSALADGPFIMCHEAAHRLAIASEQEANFAAFLACADSSDVRLAYSGYYNAFSYCFNALARVDENRALAVVQKAAESDLGGGVALLWADREATHEHYAAYEGPFKEVGTTVNDSYLKSFGEDEGVRSYGLVTDYLIAWHQTL